MEDKLTCLLGREPRSIALFRALKLGDLICCIPAVRALREAHPRAEITLIGLPWAAEFTDRFPQYFDDFIAFPGYPGLPEQPFDPAEVTDFLRRMQQRGFDVFLQLQGNGTIVNAMAMLTGASVCGGYYPAGHAEQYCPDEFTFLPYPQEKHEILRHLDLMRFLGIPAASANLEFPVWNRDQIRLHALPEWQALSEAPYICVHPGGISGRRWPARHFALLADALAEQGFRIVLTGVAAEKPLAGQVAELMQHTPVCLAGKTDLGMLAALLQSATLLLSNDTGVAHLGFALHVPSVVVYTSSSPREWGPFDTSRHRIIIEEENAKLEDIWDEILDLLYVES
ncbi:MAG: glycosyltransferase family 9 protein [Siphonobacter aquaeclarae]|nr:glycosyltransferase family 9 protein [Siphonobacter aquaeclarae]